MKISNGRWISVLLALTMLVSLLSLQVFAAGASAAAVDFSTAEAAASFDLYSTSAGGFAVQDGKLVPAGDAGEFKAIYKDDGRAIRSVSVEIHPVGNDGVYAGLYINAANAANGQDKIDALYLGIESNFAGWDDAINRVDITLGQFTQGWGGEVGARFVSETGLGNNLFAGNKEPLRLHARLDGNVMEVTVSLVSNPGRQVTTTYTLPEGTDLTLGDVGIRSQYNNAMYDNFTVEYVEEAVQDMPGHMAKFENADDFSLYSTSAGGFTAANGKLVPTGDAGEFKAIYNGTGKVHSVSVELHPVNSDGPIYGGLYIGASDAGNAQDNINALYIGIESHFTGWDDAANRIDLVFGNFPNWIEYSRTVSETGIGNNLFSGGIKEPLLLKADITGNMVVVTVSLVRDPSISFSTTYIADRDLSVGQVGIRSHYNNAMYDNFAVNCAPSAEAAVNGFDNTDAFDLYTTSAGGFAAEEGKLVPTGDAGEFKAIYKENGKLIHSVSMELHPRFTDGPIYGGLYIGASDATNAQDSINALYVGVESHFTGWEDAPNRIDLVLGNFPGWIEYSRTVSETGLGNNLFSGGVKEPLLLRADISGNTVTATVSLLSDPSRYISTTFVADRDLSVGQVGIRSHHNNASYDNFTVNAVAAVNGQGYATVNQAVQMAGEHAVTLLGNCNETVIVRGSATIDLAGYHMSNVVVPEGSVLKLADSTTNSGKAGGSATVYGTAISMGTVDSIGVANGKAYMSVAAENVYTVRPYVTEIMQQVSLGDDLAMRFPVKAEPGTVVNVIVAGETVSYDLNAMIPDENGFYTVSAYLAAAQMTEEITVQFVYGGTVAQEKIYTIRGYADAVLSGNYPEKTKNLVKWMLQYGAKAQQYFEVNTDRLANAGYELEDTTVPAQHPEMVVEGNIGGMSFYGASLVFKNKIAVRFYFTGSVDGVSFGDYEAVEKGGMHYVEVAGINPQDYSNLIDLTATKDGESLTVSYSPMNYIIRMSQKGNAAMKALLNALYGYHEAALRFVSEYIFFGPVDGQVDLSNDSGANTGVIQVGANGNSHAYVNGLNQDPFYFEGQFQIHSAQAGAESPKFGMYVEENGIRAYFYVQMNEALQANTVGCVQYADGAFDWDNAVVATVEEMDLSGAAVTLGVLKNGPEIRFYVNGVCVLSSEGNITGAAAAGVFGFNTGMTLSRYSYTGSVDSIEETYTFAQTQTYRNGQDIIGQWGVDTYTEGGEYGIGDPFVLRHNGKYYMYPSSGVAENGISGVKVFESDDLVNWTYKGFALEAAEATQAYAPEVIYHNGWFYMCQSGNKGTGHYIYKSESPIGPFQAVTGDFEYGIDGSLWLDDDGNLFFLYAKSKSIRVVPIDQSTMTPPNQTNIHKVLTASMNGGWVEGPGLFRRGDILYLTYSGNKVTADNYRVGYSYQIGSDPMGDFIQPEDNILIMAAGPDNFRGLGHNSNVVGPNLDSWYAAYHNLVGVDGPQRRYMLDKLVTNGACVMANGPTYWDMPVPERPDFESWGTENMNISGEVFFSGVASGKVYTAEFNFTPVKDGISRMLFGYVNENNYCQIEWNDATKTLTASAITNGQTQVLGSKTIENLSANVLHTVRIEQGASRLLVYMDSMRKLDVEHAGVAGKIGARGLASWGYIAFSNDALGTSDFDNVKLTGSAFPAIHYLKGENRGFYFADAQPTDGIRQGEKESSIYDETTVSYDLKLATAGDWVKYAISANAEGVYDLSAYMSANAGAKLEIVVDGAAIYEFTVPASEETGMTQLVLGQLPLTAGNHTLKIRLLDGSVQVKNFALMAEQVETEPEA